MHTEPVLEPSDRPLAAPPTGLFAWYREWTSEGRRSFWACFCGWALDAMDVHFYSYVIPTLIALWGLTKAEAGSIATVVLLSSSLGGWIGGILCDRIGRVKTLQIAILWFSFFTLLSGFTNSYSELLVVRALHGLGFGGEWAAGATLIGEMIRDRYRATAGGTVHSAWAVGGGMAALLFGLAFSVFPPEWAWRVLMACGALPAIFVVYVRRFITEPPIFKDRVKTGGSFLQIFHGDVARMTFLGALLAVGAQGAGYAVTTWLPTYLKTVRELSVLNTTGYMMVFTVAAFLGYVSGGYLADAIGRRRNFCLFATAQAIVVIAYMFIPISNSTMLLLGFPLGYTFAGVYSAIGTVLNEIFPTRCRGNGIGFCFNFGRAIGSVFPMLIGFLGGSYMPLGEAIGIVTASCDGLVVVAALLLPETRGSALQA